MSENTELPRQASRNEQQNRFMGRKLDRPMPPQGCSWAFYVFLALLFAVLFVAFLLFRSQK